MNNLPPIERIMAIYETAARNNDLDVAKDIATNIRDKLNKTENLFAASIRAANIDMINWLFDHKKKIKFDHVLVHCAEMGTDEIAEFLFTKITNTKHYEAALKIMLTDTNCEKKYLWFCKLLVSRVSLVFCNKIYIGIYTDDALHYYNEYIICLFVSRSTLPDDIYMHILTSAKALKYTAFVSTLETKIALTRSGFTSIKVFKL